MAQRTTLITEFEPLAALETDDHVIWNHSLCGGYGRVMVDGERIYTHRLALLRRDGVAPVDRPLACHLSGLGCPRNCMNYRHLYWGSKLDNMADMVNDGTSSRGERHGRHKLTEADVREIRRLRTSVPHRQIAQQFGVSPKTVEQVVVGRSWAWLD